MDELVSDTNKPALIPTEDDLLRRYIRHVGPTTLWVAADKLPNLGLSFSISGSPPPSAFMTRPRDTPLQRLPAELLDQILSSLDRASLKSLCLVSRALCIQARPHLYRVVSLADWFDFLRLVRSLTAQKGPAWRSKALASCREISVTTSCSSDDPAHAVCSHRDSRETLFIMGEVENAITTLAQRSDKIESLRWRFCRFLPPAEGLFEELSKHPLRSLHLEDVCPTSSTAARDELLLCKPQVCVMQARGWSKIAALDHLRSLRIESIAHSCHNAAVVSPPLNELLTKCRNLEELCLHFIPSDPKSSGWVLLDGLDGLSWRRLAVLELHYVAAPSSSSLAGFLQRHVALTTLTWRAPPWGMNLEAIQAAIRAASGDGHAGLTAFIRGSFTVEPGVAIYLPKLRTVDVSNMGLLSAILKLSRPESVHNIDIDLRSSLPVPEMQDRTRIQDLYHSRYKERSPMPAVAESTSIIEASVIIRGSAAEPNWSSQVSQIFKQLPPSLSILSIYMPSIGVRTPVPVEERPLKLPLKSLSHLTNLRLLSLPHHVLCHEEKSAIAADRIDPDVMQELRKSEVRKERPQKRFEAISRLLAESMPRLDAIYFIGSGPLDSCDLPTWRLSLDWAGPSWSADYSCWAANVVRKTRPPPPTPAELERSKSSFSRLDGWLHLLSLMPSVRYRHRQMKLEEAAKRTGKGAATGKKGKAGAKGTNASNSKGAGAKGDKAEASTTVATSATSSAAKKSAPDFEIEEASSACLCSRCFMQEMLPWDYSECLSRLAREHILFHGIDEIEFYI